MILVIKCDNIRNQIHTICANIIQPANKWRDKAGTCFSCHQCLCCTKAKCDIHHSAIVAKMFTYPKPINCKRHFDCYIFSNSSEFFTLFQHGFIVCCGDLSAYRPIDQGTNFCCCIKDIATCLGYQRWVCRHAINHTCFV